ncbi:hypothetical protein Cgig2_033693 [Carnegiea gigantea]|uniref:PIN-like protein n=1 Tax=Carnegiea gigantea TaxID=171969 RepID=A0A9Q1K6V4_9CARY|nr:hypothetical protein Cgig2_033693 [Carnegiea gigantea]
MGLLNLFLAASMPVVKVFLLISLGLFLALDHVDILGGTARKLLNHVVHAGQHPLYFYSWVSIWVDTRQNYKSSKTSQGPHYRSMLGRRNVIINTTIIITLSINLTTMTDTGNLGYLIIIIIPAICKEKGSPFGAADVCQAYGLSYASLSLALGAIYLWVYVYNILRITSKETVETAAVTDVPAKANDEESNINGDRTSVNCTEPQLPSLINPSQPSSESYITLLIGHLLLNFTLKSTIVPLPSRVKQGLNKFSKKMNLKAVLAPSTIGAEIRLNKQMTYLFKFFPDRAIDSGLCDWANSSTQEVVDRQRCSSPCPWRLSFYARGSGVHFGIIIGILAVRYIFLPLLGMLIVRSAVRFGLVDSDNPLFQFVLLLQYAVPPAMNIATITQQFGAGQSECSIIMLWAYGLASITLTLWCTLFLWLVAK